MFHFLVVVNESNGMIWRRKADNTFGGTMLETSRTQKSRQNVTGRND